MMSAVAAESPVSGASGPLLQAHVHRQGIPGVCPDPMDLWTLLPDEPWRFWLDGGDPAAASRYSYLAWGHPVWTFRGSRGQGEIQDGLGRTRPWKGRDPLITLRELMARSRVEGSPGPEVSASFGGGAVGFWSFESARYFDQYPALGRGSGLDFCWVLPRFWAVLDRRARSTTLVCQGGPDPSPLHSWKRRIASLKTSGLVSRHSAVRGPGPLEPAVARRMLQNRARFEAQVRRLKKYIAAGDIYQANLSHGLVLPWSGKPGFFFNHLRRLNPSPYAALFQFPDFALASCSPELLLRVRGDRVATRPIAGTRPRGASPREDARLSGELLLSPKERAEHVMLLDLERNDLGRVCRPGTVRVTERMVLEKYSHVTHIVSQVDGRLRPGLDGLDAVRALFPGGTITGCPKIRCMEILAKMEREPRGPFYGSAGWIGFNGDMDLNILIRTALIKGHRLALRVGAGIVADSDPRREYDETLHKARALLEAYARSRGRA
jgi:para-aminobenzoate synthetase component I